MDCPPSIAITVVRGQQREFNVTLVLPGFLRNPPRHTLHCASGVGSHMGLWGPKARATFGTKVNLLRCQFAPFWCQIPFNNVFWHKIEFSVQHGIWAHGSLPKWPHCSFGRHPWNGPLPPQGGPAGGLVEGFGVPLSIVGACQGVIPQPRCPKCFTFSGECNKKMVPP